MLTHVNEANKPAMVNISTKIETLRQATAAIKVFMPDEMLARFVNGDLITSKGPVFATAIIAGTMAAKKTHELIPFCHQIPIDSCDIVITITHQNTVQIDCTVSTTAKTGVEMEALTGANVAALTVYDMCKSLTQDMVIQDCRLIAKTGGKRDFRR